MVFLETARLAEAWALPTDLPEPSALGLPIVLTPESWKPAFQPRGWKPFVGFWLGDNLMVELD